MGVHCPELLRALPAAPNGRVARSFTAPEDTMAHRSAAGEHAESQWAAPQPSSLKPTPPLRSSKPVATRVLLNSHPGPGAYAAASFRRGLLLRGLGYFILLILWLPSSNAIVVGARGNAVKAGCQSMEDTFTSALMKLNASEGNHDCKDNACSIHNDPRCGDTNDFLCSLWGKWVEQHHQLKPGDIHMRRKEQQQHMQRKYGIGGVVSYISSVVKHNNTALFRIEMEGVDHTFIIECNSGKFSICRVGLGCTQSLISYQRTTYRSGANTC